MLIGVGSKHCVSGVQRSWHVNLVPNSRFHRRPQMLSISTQSADLVPSFEKN